ncbi:hypothetical protein GYA49_00940, partial [Candidatus Beckwithbacteria bacterium]|nr:hypothetical protein [Candidatus Beckwithbacteria bacterium]
SVPESGDYIFKATVYAPSTKSDSMYLQFNNETKKIWNFASSSGFSYKKKSLVSNTPLDNYLKNLEAGKQYTISFYNREKAATLYNWQLNLVKPTVVEVPPTITRCKTGLNSFSVNTPCSDDSDDRLGSFYRYMTYQCYGYDKVTEGGSTSCKSSSTWKEYAEKYCADKPNPECSNSEPIDQNCPSGITSINLYKTCSDQDQDSIDKFYYGDFVCGDGYKQSAYDGICRNGTDWVNYAIKFCKENNHNVCPQPMLSYTLEPSEAKIEMSINSYGYGVNVLLKQSNTLLLDQSGITYKWTASNPAIVSIADSGFSNGCPYDLIAPCPNMHADLKPLSSGNSLVKVVAYKDNREIANTSLSVFVSDPSFSTSTSSASIYQSLDSGR